MDKNMETWTIQGFTVSTLTFSRERGSKVNVSPSFLVEVQCTLPPIDQNMILVVVQVSTARKVSVALSGRLVSKVYLFHHSLLSREVCRFSSGLGFSGLGIRVGSLGSFVGIKGDAN